jgi:hypothetical protein
VSSGVLDATGQLGDAQRAQLIETVRALVAEVETAASAAPPAAETTP